jgi:hypothetical protein
LKEEIILFNNYLTLLNNDAPLTINSLSLEKKGEEDIFTIEVYPKYPPKTMVMNVLYDDEENTAYCFEKDIEVEIQTSIDPMKTEIVSKNKERIYVGELLDMWLYTFDKKGECFDENQDHSNIYEIIVTGPINSIYQFTKTYYVSKTNNPELQCKNEYNIITTENDIYKYAGDNLIKVRAKRIILDQYNQVCLPLGYSLFYLEYEFYP